MRRAGVEGLVDSISVDRRLVGLLAGLCSACLQLDTSGPGADSPSLTTQTGGTTSETEGTDATAASSSTDTGVSPSTSPPTSDSSSSEGPSSDSGSASSTGEPLIWVPFSDPIAVDGLDTDADERSPSMTSDLVSLVFVRDSFLRLATRRNASAGWNANAFDYPLVNMPLPDQHFEIASARINALGDELHFARNDSGRFDVFLRAGLPPVFSAPTVNSGGDDDVYFAARESGLEAVFASNRDGNFEIYLAERMSTASDWQVVGPLTDANAGGDETSPNLGSITRLVMFVSNSESGADKDVYRLEYGDHGPPVRVEELSISGIDEADVWLSADESTVLLTRERPDGHGDIYIATR